MPEPGTIFGFVLVGAFAAWAVRLYLRDARAYRAGRGDERYAWLRRSHPNHPALPTAPPRRILRTLPQRWGWRHILIVLAQAGVIGGLTYGMISDMGPDRLFGFLTINIILVAFGTAALTRLWDLSVGALARRRAGARQQ